MKITVKLHKNSYELLNSENLPLLKIKKYFHKLVIKNTDNETLAYLNPFIDTLTQGYTLHLYPKNKENLKMISIATAINDSTKFIITDLHYICTTLIPHQQWQIVINNVDSIIIDYDKNNCNLKIEGVINTGTLEVIGIAIGIYLNEKSLGNLN